MTVRLTSEIQETSRITVCSACRNQQHDVRHVDFDAACDRGVWYGNEEAVKISLDDLVLCEHCIVAACQKLGVEDSVALKRELADHEQKLDRAQKALRQARNYADTMEDALQKRPEQVHIDHRKKPRKELEIA